MNEWRYALWGLGKFIRAGLTGNLHECGQIADEMARSAGRDPMQERWDEQIELNLSASHFGRGREADRRRLPRIRVHDGRAAGAELGGRTDHAQRHRVRVAPGEGD